MSFAVGASVEVTIDTASKQDAELVSDLLPVPAKAGSVRGVGFVRIRCGAREVREILDAARAAVERHGLTWLRVRVGDDDEHVFRRR